MFGLIGPGRKVRIAPASMIRHCTAYWPLICLFRILLPPPATAQVRGVQITPGAAAYRLGGGTGDVQFNLPTAAHLFPDGTSLLLDHRDFAVYVISPTGRILDRVGREGEGPGEMKAVRVMGVIPPATLYLIDYMLTRVTTYRWDGSDLRLDRTVRVRRPVNASCATGDKVVVWSYDERSDADPEVLHLYDTTFVHLRSVVDPPVGEEYPGTYRERRALNNHLVGGWLACLPEREVVISLPYTTGEVAAYALDGTRLWQTTLTDFVLSGYERIGGTIGVGFADAEETRSVTTGVHQVSSEYALVQIGTLHRSAPFDYAFPTVETRVIRLSDGKVVGRQTDLPLVLAAAPGWLLFAGYDPEFWLELRPVAVSGR